MADVAAALSSWSTTASSNSPSDATTIGAGLADNFQQIQATVRADLASKGADIASASSTDIGAVAGKQHDITGTTTITSFGTVAAGIEKILQFDGALTLTHSANLILPGAVNITTVAGDVGIFVSEGAGVWRCVSFSGKNVSATNLSASGTLAVTGKITSTAGINTVSGDTGSIATATPTVITTANSMCNGSGGAALLWCDIATSGSSYQAFAVVMYDGANALLPVNVDGANIVIDLNAGNVRVTQNSGGNATVRYRFLTLST